MRLDPNDYQAHWALGWAYLYSREQEKALASYQRARNLNPNDAELLAEMSNFLIYIGQPKQAIDQLKEAIRLNPNHERWYVEYLGWAYEHAGMPKRGDRDFRTGDRSKIRPRSSFGILPTLAAAYAYPAVGRTDDAQDRQEILSLQPEFSTAEVASRGPYKTKELTDRYVNVLRRAGLPE